MKKIASLILILISLSGFYQIQAQNQIYKKSVAGSWLGKLDLGAVSLRLIYNLRINENDSIVASLDSPDQGAKGIKIGPVTLDSNKIKIMAPLLLSEYNGTIKNDTLIEGTFKQAGKTLPLNLKKLKKTFTFNRPQKPKSPFPYISEDVTFKNEKADITLAGTLTVPEGNGPFPAVIMITGSGSQNRNEELMGHEPFLVIADYLSRNGIAVLRYDDRGVGKSQNTSSPSTSADFATDAESAFNYLKTNTRIDPKRIGLAGHSEGGIIASMTASANKGIGFVISLAGPGVTGEKILYKQNYDLSKASGMEEKELKAAISMSRKMYSVVKKERDNKKATDELTAILKKAMIKQKSSPEEIKTALEGFPASAAALTSPWYRSFLVTDPADYWKKVTCPVLALNGEKDLQVAADINLPAIEKSLKSGGNNAVKTIKFPELNHLFQHCKTGLPSEYGEIEETISPEVLKAMSDWIHGL
jgi:pimeloyl-ACP methyl ester carboxylesterase